MGSAGRKRCVRAIHPQNTPHNDVQSVRIRNGEKRFFI